MLRISKLTDYATMVLSFLASKSPCMASAARIADAIHLTTPTVSKILKILCEAKLVKSFRGTGGGYELARPSKDITVAEVVSAIEGKLAMTECCSKESVCALDSLCTMKENWQLINQVILKALAGLTLHDMTRSLHQHALVIKGIPIKVLNTHGK